MSCHVAGLSSIVSHRCQSSYCDVIVTTATPRAAPEQGPRLHEGAVAELWAAAEQRAVAELRAAAEPKRKKRKKNDTREERTRQRRCGTASTP
jgi:hypothetical protein